MNEPLTKDKEILRREVNWIAKQFNDSKTINNILAANVVQCAIRSALSEKDAGFASAVRLLRERIEEKRKEQAITLQGLTKEIRECKVCFSVRCADHEQMTGRWYGINHTISELEEWISEVFVGVQSGCEKEVIHQVTDALRIPENCIPSRVPGDVSGSPSQEPQKKTKAI